MTKFGWIAIATAAITFQCAHAGPTTAGGGVGGSGSTSTATRAGDTSKATSDPNGLKTWEGDQWKVGGGTTWGWYSYDESGFFYGTGNPSPWDPGSLPNIPEEGYCSVCMD